MNAVLTPLREDLDIAEGPRLHDGQPSWVLHDPARHRFYRIDWMSFEILSRWSLGDANEIAGSVNAVTPLGIDATHVLMVQDFLQQNQLLTAIAPGQARRMAEMADGARASWWSKALHHYLFFRVPLWRPDAWLARLLPVAEIAFSRGFLLATGIALLLGLLMVLRQSEVFFRTLFDTFSASGALSYAIALVFVKLLHELGHAFAAKRHGCRVPVMGMAFVLLWPMAYTDTNETWRLADARQRLQVAGAGMMAELVVAAWATFAWSFLPDGGVKTAVFFLATTSWLTTLAVNLSPFMRFDGYFVLSDWLDMPNLHDRSFALARWRLREALFGLGDAPPEELPARRRNFLIAFAFITWIYRLIVFFGIALLVYQFFFKLLGILMFAVEIGWFIVRPVVNELLAWRELLPRVLRGGRPAGKLAFPMLTIAVLVSLMFLPLPYRLVVGGVIRPAEYLVIRPPAGATLASIDVQPGQQVTAGQSLIRLEQPDLHGNRELARVREEAWHWQASSAGLNDSGRARRLSDESEWARAIADGKAIADQIDSLWLRAPFGGVVLDVAPDLHAGQWLPSRERIGLLVNPASGFVAETYIDETVLKTVRVGDHAQFVDAEGRNIALVVAALDRDATHQLPSGLFSSAAGGPVSVRAHDGVLVPEQAVYRVLLKPTHQNLPSVTGAPVAGRFVAGAISIETEPVRLGSRYLERALSVLGREAGF